MDPEIKNLQLYMQNKGTIVFSIIVKPTSYFKTVLYFIQVTGHDDTVSSKKVPKDIVKPDDQTIHPWNL